MIKAVFFDVGETLIDETRDWGVWADALRIPRLTLFAALGAVIARGAAHTEVFRMLGVEEQAKRFRVERASLGSPYHFLESDLYPDVRSSLGTLRAAGLFIGIAGNQPPEALQALEALSLPTDFISTSAKLGAAKPAVEFFHRLTAATNGLAPHDIAYVGDCFDKDAYPAIAAGLHGIRIRRGPWGHIQKPDSAQPPVTEIRTLDELPALLRTL